jgi:hypothetical protein
LYFLASIKGSESSLINLKLERQGKSVEFSLKMNKQTVKYLVSDQQIKQHMGLEPEENPGN